MAPCGRLYAEDFCKSLGLAVTHSIPSHVLIHANCAHICVRSRLARSPARFLVQPHARPAGVLCQHCAAVRPSKLPMAGAPAGRKASLAINHANHLWTLASRQLTLSDLAVIQNNAAMWLASAEPLKYHVQQLVFWLNPAAYAKMGMAGGASSGANAIGHRILPGTWHRAIGVAACGISLRSAIIAAAYNIR